MGPYSTGSRGHNCKHGASATAVARQWLERLPPDLELQNVLSRFQCRFIENMASLARRIRLDNPHFVRQDILNGLRPELQMAVKLQHPTTLEEIAAAAAAIAEAGAVSVDARHSRDRKLSADVNRRRQFDATKAASRA